MLVQESTDSTDLLLAPPELSARNRQCDFAAEVRCKHCAECKRPTAMESSKPGAVSSSHIMQRPSMVRHWQRALPCAPPQDTRQPSINRETRRSDYMPPPKTLPVVRAAGGLRIALNCGDDNKAPTAAALLEGVAEPRKSCLRGGDSIVIWSDLLVGISIPAGLAAAAVVDDLPALAGFSASVPAADCSIVTIRSPDVSAPRWRRATCAGDGGMGAWAAFASPVALPAVASTSYGAGPMRSRLADGGASIMSCSEWRWRPVSRMSTAS